MESSLIKAYREWNRKVLYPYIRSNPEPNFSLPYYVGISKRFDSNRKSIMIVGQEARNYGKYSELFTEWPLEKIIKWNSDYLDRQLLDEKMT